MEMAFGKSNKPTAKAMTKASVTEPEELTPPPSYLAKYGADVVDIDTSLPESYVVNIFGQTGTGKDSFCLTAPRPIVWFESEKDGIYRARKGVGTDGVFRIDISTPPDSGAGHEKEDENWKRACHKVFDNMIKAYDQVMKDPNIKTVVIDTETALWDLVRAAQFGRLFQIMQLQFAHVNPMMEQFYSKARLAGKNLIMVQQAEYMWVTKTNALGEAVLDKRGEKQREQSDDLEGKGWKNTGYRSDIVIALEKVRAKKSKTALKVYRGEILKCGFGEGVEDRVMENDDITWPHLIAMIKGEV